MDKPTFDPGLTQQFTAPLRRAINKDGSFNVRRIGGSWRDTHPYLRMIRAPWPVFLGIILVGYVIANIVFALLYFSLGPGHLQGGDAPTSSERLMNAFFFSAHTLTTVGYGSIAPRTAIANILAALEALTGLLGFAIATGLLYGRFSRPSAKIGFSRQLLVAPYQEGTSLQFRIVNQRENALMELQATVVMMTVEGPPGQQKRIFKPLRLERDQIYFFPLTWTIVHPIDKESPVHGKTPADLAATEAEILILIKGWDETFSQTVHSRYSYRYDELVWNARFAPAFHIDDRGDMVLELDHLGRVTETA